MPEENRGSWYTIIVSTNCEDKVKQRLECTIENMHLQDSIFEILVPMQDEIVVKNGVKKVVKKKKFPGYVFIRMVMNRNTWYVVANSDDVRGFANMEKEPIPLTEEEVERVGLEDTELKLDFEVGENVTIIEGAMIGTVAKVQAINENKQTLTLLVDLFGGRETPVELDIASVRKM